ncbi:MAG: methionyl-tRNA formyltransferase [Nitrospira sp.]
MRIVFMGTPEFAVPSLNALLDSPHDVVGVVTQPDRPKGRGQDLATSPIKQLALERGVPILQPLKMKDPAFLEALAAWKPDLIAVTAFGRILPKVVLDLPPKGCMNVHGSLLPKYRGAGPIQWAIIKGEHETGITTMLMDEGMDTGAMLLQETLPITPVDTAGTLSTRLAEVGGRLLVTTIAGLLDGTVAPKPQDHSRATMAPLLQKEDGLLDWTQSAVDLVNRIRGLTPWPGAYTFAKNERWAIWRASVMEQSGGGKPGTVHSTTKDAILVTTGKDLLVLTELQPANSRKMTAAQYLAGHPIPPGLVLGAGLAPATNE